MKNFGLFFGLLALMSTGLFAQGKVYKIGDVGPAGGLIFYDKGVFSEGWRYLEAAPENTEFKDVEWGAKGKNIPGTLLGVGKGKENTALIIENFVKFKERTKQQDRAAQLCDKLEYGGFNDWFLPSLDELRLMFMNLKEKGIGGFSDKKYWSSTQHSKNEALVLTFGFGWGFGPIIQGTQHNNMKFDKYYVRAIRAF